MFDLSSKCARADLAGMLDTLTELIKALSVDGAYRTELGSGTLIHH